MPELVIITVRVQPRARVNQISCAEEDHVRVRVTAPPSDGRANQAVVRLIADVLDLPRSAISVVRGATGRTKIIAIQGLNRAASLARLRGAAGRSG